MNGEANCTVTLFYYEQYCSKIIMEVQVLSHNSSYYRKKVLLQKPLLKYIRKEDNMICLRRILTCMEARVIKQRMHYRL